MKTLLATVAALTLTAAASQAFAQAGPTASANAGASAEIVTPIAITNVDGISFGRLAAGAGGTVSVDAAGALVSSAPNMKIAGSTGSAATFDVTGQANLAYTRSVPLTVTLSDGTNSMVAALTGSASDVLNGSGTDQFDVTGVLTVGAAQPAGAYTGSFSVSVNYN